MTGWHVAGRQTSSRKACYIQAGRRQEDRGIGRFEICTRLAETQGVEGSRRRLAGKRKAKGRRAARKYAASEGMRQAMRWHAGRQNCGSKTG